MKRLDVAVVGCGTAGAAAALFLSRAGHSVTLVERAPAPGPIGAGIVLQPSGLAVLRALGLEQSMLQAGARLDRLRCTTRGRALFELRYARAGADLFGLGLHRGVLFAALFDALRASDVELVLGHTVRRLEADGDRHYLRLERTRLGTFDLVVIADGARSQLRDQTFHLHETKRYPSGALWFVGQARQSLPAELHQAVDGTREMIGLLPTGFGPDRSRGPLASLFYSVSAAELDALRATPLQRWTDHVAARFPRLAPVLDQIASWDDLLFAAYHDVVLPRWHDRGVVLLGDAAHATSPQLGQGCNLALGDAAALDEALRGSSLPEALARYSASRRAVLAFYQRASRWLTPLFQSDDTLFGPLRDLAFPLVSRIPYFERRMIETMAGLSTGWLSARRG